MNSQIAIRSIVTILVLVFLILFVYPLWPSALHGVMASRKEFGSGFSVGAFIDVLIGICAVVEYRRAPKRLQKALWLSVIVTLALIALAAFAQEMQFAPAKLLGGVTTGLSYLLAVLVVVALFLRARNHAKT